MGCNPLPGQDVAASDAGRCTAGRTRDAAKQAEGGILDADLAALVAAWPLLAEPIRAAIRALVGTVKGPL